MEDKERIHYLLGAWADKTATEAEENELMHFMQEAEEDSELKEFMIGLWQQFKPGQDFSLVNWDSMFDRIKQQGKVYPIANKRKIFNLVKVTAAAAILIFLFVGYWFLVREKNPAKRVAVTTQPRFKNDILPARDKAILTLGDGSQVILDDVSNGNLTTQGSSTLIKLDGQLNYLQQASGNEQIVYNTITTAKGKQYTLTLSDGTKLWLNANSSLRFPASFTGKDREVELTGEGYFEVAHNALKPFQVKMNDMSVQVLGTHFNIHAYKDEVIKTTLLEGSVKFSKGNQLQLLTPGQQVQVTPGGEVKLIPNADTDHTISWKDGLFDFDNQELPAVMNELSRWYDINVSYKDSTPRGHYSGAIRRGANLSEVLKMLEALGGVEFSIDGNKIIVKAI